MKVIITDTLVRKLIRESLKGDLRKISLNESGFDDFVRWAASPSFTPGSSTGAAAGSPLQKAMSGDSYKGLLAAERKPITDENVESYLGQLASYTSFGPPDVRIVAKVPLQREKYGRSGIIIARVYSKSKIQDPVSQNKGNLISTDTIRDFESWSAHERLGTDFPRLESDLRLYAMKPNQAASQALYDKYKLFVPYSLYEPVYEATADALEKSQSFKCTLTAGSFASLMKDVFTFKSQNAIDRLVPCVADYTYDSVMYGLVQTIVGFLGPIGFGVSVAADIVPGIILIGYFLHKKQNKLALYYLLLLIIFTATPLGIEKIVKQPVANIITNIIGVNVLVNIADAISTTLFGSDSSLTDSEIRRLAGDKDIKDVTGEELKSRIDAEFKGLTLSGVLDPQGLSKKYPAW